MPLIVDRHAKLVTTAMSASCTFPSRNYSDQTESKADETESVADAGADEGFSGDDNSVVWDV